MANEPPSDSEWVARVLAMLDGQPPEPTDEPPFDSRRGDCDPTSMTGHARTTAEHEVAGTSSPGQPTGPTEQADLQGQPTTSPRPPEVDRLVAAALALDAAFQLDRAFENAAVVREFRLACQAVRDIDRTGKWESDAD